MDYSLAKVGNTSITEAKFDHSIYYRFMAYVDVKPASMRTYAEALKNFFSYLDTEGISHPTREDILSYRDTLKAEHKPTTIQTYMVAVRLLFRWTAEENIYPNVADHIKGAKIDRNHKKDYLTSKQVKKVLNQVDRTTETGKRDYAILTLMITGGLRTIEVARADVNDLATVGDSTVLYIQGKGKDEKTEFIKIAPAVEDAIREYLNNRKPVKEKALFTSTSNNNYGKRMTTRSISGIAKKYMRMAGLDNDRLTAHSLRHTAVTLSLLQGRSLDEVQAHARHSSINTTMIYNHRIESAKNGCADAIAELIF